MRSSSFGSAKAVRSALLQGLQLQRSCTSAYLLPAEFCGRRAGRPEAGQESGQAGRQACMTPRQPLCHCHHCHLMLLNVESVDTKRSRAVTRVFTFACLQVMLASVRLYGQAWQLCHSPAVTAAKTHCHFCLSAVTVACKLPVAPCHEMVVAICIRRIM